MRRVKYHGYVLWPFYEIINRVFSTSRVHQEIIVLAGKIEDLCKQIDTICDHARDLEKQFSNELAEVHPNYIHSARNLLHYVALRQGDIRDLQEQLTKLGLSSLSSSEQHVMESLEAVRYALRRINGCEDTDTRSTPEDFDRCTRRLETHKDDLLGNNVDGRNVKIMVTLPTEAAHDYQLVIDFVVAGMGTARINCAHDSSADWLGMIRNIKRASKSAGKTCNIVMDLAGPKVRSGPLMPGPGVLCLRQRRDALGRVLAPKRVRFIADDSPSRSKKTTVVPVPRELIDQAGMGDIIRFRDTRDRKRRLIVVGKDKKGLILESHKRAYIATGTELTLVRQAEAEKLRFNVGKLPPAELPIVLWVDDILLLDNGRTPGEPANVDDDGLLIAPAHVSCMPVEILDRVSVGSPVLLNDGKIEGVVERVTEDGLEVRITRAKASGSRLRANKSINFPGSDLQLPGLTDTDRKNLEFVVKHASAVGLSFVRSPADVIVLQQELTKRTDRQLGIILKIETENGFQELPRILLAAMRTYPAGIMIARGDLAVECGWERLAEIQEEILWMCEAAQIPVIWATQVLEDKAKKGRPSRAEITDAAMAQRADCVMLNKGPHILAAIRMLDNILRRMQDHQHKKAPTLRKLSISDLH